MDVLEPVILDSVFHALADETRRRILALLGERPGSSTTELTAAFPQLSRWAVMKHLTVLRDAELIQTLPEGRRRRHYRSRTRLDVAVEWLATQGASV